MANLSIRGLDDESARLLKANARREGLSVNAYIIGLLQRDVGVLPADRRETCNDLDALAGTWSDEDVRVFTTAIDAFEQTDEELWR